MKRLIILFALIGSFVSCDKDEFAETNQDPTQVNKPDLTYLFTRVLYNYDESTYTEWFYDHAQYAFPWTQTTVSSTGNTGDVILDKEHGNRWNFFYEGILPLTSEIREIVDNQYKEEEQIAYQYIKYVTYPIQIMQAMKVSDMYGSMPYTEAGRARYSNPPLLTPVYDNQETLFTTWNNELKKTIEVLTTEQKYNGKVVNQIPLGNQDFIYGGSYKSWAKFANSLRLRIAARLLNINRTLALQIVNDVVSNPVGIITENKENFYWSAASDYYHFQNDIWFGVGGKNLIDFLRDNQDPRLRFMFSKNDFNSKVIQGFFVYNALAKANAKKDIPTYIRAFVNSHVEKQTYKLSETKDTVVDVEVFDSWKGPGEPWVRYFGAPTAPDAKQNPAVNSQYFITENFKITLSGSSKTYSPTSYYNEKNIVTNNDEVYPDAPNVAAPQHKDNVPYHSLLFSAAEVNLYLAEFKLMGASIPGDANTYYQTAISQSVTAMDKLAKDNDILYYQSVYDTQHEATVALQTGEVDALLLKPAYSLTGNVAEDLERVYIQQYLNNLNNPNELFVTVRRSGVPKTGSTILPREPFLDGGVELTVPRRFTVKSPTQDDINYQNQLKGIQDQGFTPGNSEAKTLHDQRLWYDKTAPDWGVGPAL